MDLNKKKLIILMYLTEHCSQNLFKNKLNQIEIKYLYNILTFSSSNNIIKDLNIVHQTYKYNKHNLYNKIKNSKNYNKNIEPKNTIIYNCIYSAIKDLIPLVIYEELELKYKDKLKHFEKTEKNGIPILPTGFKL